MRWANIAKNRYCSNLPIVIPYPIRTPVAPCISMMPKDPIMVSMMLRVSDAGIFEVSMEKGMNIEPKPRPRLRP